MWKKNATGRQLARVSAINYHETLWSDLFPGSQLTMHCMMPAVINTETSLDLAKEHRKQVVYRLDGGSGTDENLIWLLNRGYHLIFAPIETVSIAFRDLNAYRGCFYSRISTKIGAFYVKYEHS